MLSRESLPIVACVTPWGSGAVAIVRLSGLELRPLILELCGRVPRPWGVCHVQLRDTRGAFDDGLLTWMPAPRSYTGEDVAEISCHGNPALVERLLGACLDLGARMAAPGEFTRRALLNGKIDLCRAEAVLQTIEASSPAGLALAWNGLQGGVSLLAAEVRDALLDLGAELEAMLDYPEEGLLFASDTELDSRMLVCRERLHGAVSSYRAGRLAVDGAVVALIGPVNAGKSSLFNRLLGRPRALVSPTPGTTRDLIEAPLLLEQVRITLVDTAGERETADPLEAAGIALSAEIVARADLLLVLQPAHLPPGPELRLIEERTAGRQVLRVETFGGLANHPPAPGVLRVDNQDGSGIPALRSLLPRLLIGETPGEAAPLLGSARQHDRLAAAIRHIDAARVALGLAGPAVAGELVCDAIGELGAVLGRDSREDTLDRLFARFCVGK